MSLELVGYFFLGWLGMGVVTALLVGRILREPSGLPVPAAATVIRAVEPRPKRVSRRSTGRRDAHSANRAA